MNSLELLMFTSSDELGTSTVFWFVYCMLEHVCQWFAKFQYVGDIWNFGKHLSQLVVLFSIHIMLVSLFFISDV